MGGPLAKNPTRGEGARFRPKQRLTLCFTPCRPAPPRPSRRARRASAAAQRSRRSGCHVLTSVMAANARKAPSSGLPEKLGEAGREKSPLAGVNDPSGATGGRCAARSTFDQPRSARGLPAASPVATASRRRTPLGSRHLHVQDATAAVQPAEPLVVVGGAQRFGVFKEDVTQLSEFTEAGRLWPQPRRRTSAAGSRAERMSPFKDIARRRAGRVDRTRAALLAPQQRSPPVSGGGSAASRPARPADRRARRRYEPRTVHVWLDGRGVGRRSASTQRGASARRPDAMAATSDAPAPARTSPRGRRSREKQRPSRVRIKDGDHDSYIVNTCGRAAPDGQPHSTPTWPLRPRCSTRTPARTARAVRRAQRVALRGGRHTGAGLLRTRGGRLTPRAPSRLFRVHLEAHRCRRLGQPRLDRLISAGASQVELQPSRRSIRHVQQALVC